MKTHHPTTNTHSKHRTDNVDSAQNSSPDTEAVYTPMVDATERHALLLADRRLREGGVSQRVAIMRQIQRGYGNNYAERVIERAQTREGVVESNAPNPALQYSQAASQVSAGTTYVQRGFWGRVWGGIKAGAKAVGSAAVWAGKKVGGAIHDATMTVINLVRDLPQRFIRLAKTLVDGIVKFATTNFTEEAVEALKSGGLPGLGSWFVNKLKGGAAWAGTLLLHVFDLLGGPEAVELILHLLSEATTPLSGSEIGAAASVLGPGAIRWGDVRVNEGGILDIVFLINKKRAFTTFHTLNIPKGQRGNLGLIVHELTHVYQYERVGTLYMGQAIHAQMTKGYLYDGAAGLKEAHRIGRHLKDFNREQQAQIAEDYYNNGRPIEYEPFIRELQAGAL